MGFGELGAGLGVSFRNFFRVLFRTAAPSLLAAYIRGFTDSTIIYDYVLTDIGAQKKDKLCVPKSTSESERRVLKYADEYPERLGDSAALALYEIINDAYKCDD